jgi:hypothetical protein
MANEITHNFLTGQTLYACRFQADGDVFITDGSSDEVWGTGGRDADDYDVAMTEEDSSGHYKADFDASGNIGEGVYYVTVYLQSGASPADSDVAISQGMMNWNGTAEITLFTLTGAVTQTEQVESTLPE